MLASDPTHKVYYLMLHVISFFSHLVRKFHSVLEFISVLYLWYTIDGAQELFLLQFPRVCSQQCLGDHAVLELKCQIPACKHVLSQTLVLSLNTKPNHNIYLLYSHLSWKQYFLFMKIRNKNGPGQPLLYYLVVRPVFLKACKLLKMSLGKVFQINATLG